MTVTCGEMPFHEFIRRFDKQCVRRWRTGSGGGWSEAHVSLGWLSDGGWWVEDTRDRRHVRVWSGADQRQVRAAAQAYADTLMAGGGWEPTILYEPGVLPARAAVVAEWPPGHEPSGDVRRQV